VPIQGPKPRSVEDSASERARMGRVSGILWMISAATAVVCAFLPGSEHASLGWVLALGAVVFLYGLGSVTGAIPWQKASLGQLALGMALTIPVVGLAIYLTGASLSFIEPLLVCSLLYAAFYFPARWAWPLTIELIVAAGTPLLYDSNAIDNAFLPRYLALAAGFLAATWVMVGLKQRLVGAEQRQRDFAHRDPLTGVGNRRAFDEALRREIARRSQHQGRRRADDSGLALFIIDLDDFKGVNDRHGHPVGDAVLREAASRTQAVLRSTDHLARIGGDEFAVIAPGVNEVGARHMAESIETSVCADGGDSETPAPRASIGWSVYPADGDDYSKLIQVADRRMLSRKPKTRSIPGEPTVRVS
jgi:diguanylate cyclase (GGDEF)-like protein